MENGDQSCSPLPEPQAGTLRSTLPSARASPGHRCAIQTSAEVGSGARSRQSLWPPACPGAALSAGEQHFPSREVGMGMELCTQLPPALLAALQDHALPLPQPSQELAINKEEEAPSHSDPLSFFSCTLSKWAEGQGSGKGPRRVY